MAWKVRFRSYCPIFCSDNFAIEIELHFSFLWLIFLLLLSDITLSSYEFLHTLFWLHLYFVYFEGFEEKSPQHALLLSRCLLWKRKGADVLSSILMYDYSLGEFCGRNLHNLLYIVELTVYIWTFERWKETVYSKISRSVVFTEEPKIQRPESAPVYSMTPHIWFSLFLFLWEIWAEKLLMFIPI